MSRKEKGCSNWLWSAFFGLLVILVAEIFWADIIPFKALEFWRFRGTPLEWLRVSWPIFVWGGGFTLVASVFTKNPKSENFEAESLLAKETLLSLWAGVMEEISFRWLIFMGSIVTVKISNFLFFGWLGFGIPEWLQLNLAGPVANFFTLGYLKDVLVSPGVWAIGAGLLASNALFRDGHKYLGWFGLVNSWFIGMFFFWMLFKYGLLACILVHFTYDFLIFFVRYLDRAMERKFA